MKRIAIATLLLAILFGCKKNDTKSIEPAGQHFIIDKTFAGAIHRDTVLSNDWSIYRDYYASTDYTLGVVSFQETPLKPVTTLPVMRNSRAMQGTKAAEDTFVWSNVAINGKNLNSLHDGKGSLDWTSLYGCTISMGIGSKLVTKSGVQEEIVDMYVPKAIQIVSPEYEGEGDLLPLCDYRSFILRWNADFENDKGVVIIVEWFGTLVFGNEKEDSYVRCVDVFPDTGEALLSKEMFEGIPDTGLCHLTIMRGNVENIFMGDYSYKLFGLSEEMMDFILLRYTKHE
ncbi:MAG: hypothetical protein J5939_01970 [Bacteroidales bacterium]|nr:hypothetical protein [Bacteroidales bacterium]